MLMLAVENKNMQTKNQVNNYSNQLLENLKKRKVHSPFIENIWDADHVGIQLISKFNKATWLLLLCVIDIFSKYVQVIPLKDKKSRKLLMILNRQIKAMRFFAE